jgi:hypothetical protein
MTKYISPDIYFERVVRDERFRQLERLPLDCAVFMGVSERGPIQTPTRVTSWESFKQRFGNYTEGAHLAYAVYGFFNNGGKECFITRVARIDDPVEERNASRSSTVLRDLYSRGTIRIDAASEGTWGNKLKAAVGVPKKVHRSVVTHDVVPGATTARVEVSKGFEKGALVRLTDGRQEAFVRVIGVRQGEVEWDTPVELELNRGRTTVENVEFKLTVTSDDDFEIFDNVSMDPEHSRYFEKVINRDSLFVRATDLRSPTEAPYNLPQAMTESVLEGGRDGVGWVTPEDYVGFSRGPGERRGLRAYLENEDIGLICLPDLFSSLERSEGFKSVKDVLVVQRAAIDVAENMRYVHVILEPPAGIGPIEASAYRDNFDSRHAALYYPWVKVLDENGDVITVPPCGHVAGIYAKMDEQYGVHKPPANEPISDVVGVERAIDKDTQDAIYPDGVNCIRYFRGRGIRIWGSRTMSSEALWRHVNVSRVFAMVCKSVEFGTQWAPFEPNNRDLWKRLTRLLGAFLTQMWREGFLVGQTPEQAFFVKCDEETNPPEVRDAGEVVTEVGLSIVRPLEYIVFRIGERTSDIALETEHG